MGRDETHLWVFCCAFVALAASGLPLAAAAQDVPHRAGVVIAHEDGTTVTRCVSFAEDTLSGYELLARSGFDLAVEANATGATVCSLDGEGCAFPEQSCFCRCQGNPCVYWSYWRLADDGWTYQTIGAGGTKVRDGAVEGWRWGAGTVDSAAEPPLTSLAEICGGVGDVKQAQAITETSTAASALAGGESAEQSSATPLPTQEAAPDAAAAVPAATAALGGVLIVVVGVPAVAAVVYALRKRSRS